MRSLLLFVAFLPLLLSSPLYAQTPDTVIKITDSSRAAVRQTVTSEFERWQDSMKAVRIKEDVRKHGKSLDAFLQEMSEREKAEKRQRNFRIGLVVFFLLVLAIGLIRRKSKKP
ncbi:MAG TPA: hypothetical protein VFT06_03060 [Flavisolibacter sp.]|nr:hypothetical protein [Flavisolibacter sp.]